MIVTGLTPAEVVDFLSQSVTYLELRLKDCSPTLLRPIGQTKPKPETSWRWFNQVRQAVEQGCIRIPILHAANSAAMMQIPRGALDAVRTGIALYGMDPSIDRPPVFEIHPALCLKSRVSRINQLFRGRGRKLRADFHRQETHTSSSCSHWIW